MMGGCCAIGQFKYDFHQARLTKCDYLDLLSGQFSNGYDFFYRFIHLGTLLCPGIQAQMKHVR